MTFLFLIQSCKKEETSSKVDAEGLTKEIRNLIPDSILNKMKDLGMPINGGANPPMLTKRQLLNATYFASPLTLKNSNIPSDNVQFIDYTFTFKQQNNDSLNIVVDFVSHYSNSTSTVQTGTGLGSFIVGDGCKFSVFSKVLFTINGYNSAGVMVISGSLLPNGIENLYVSGFMIDDYGDPQNYFAENGQGRVIYDSDGFSELVGTPTTWYTALPDCPCKYSDAQRLSTTLCPAGSWSDCGLANQSFHYGATYEVRWFPSVIGNPGQQCTYDINGNLITGGLAAGSPDKVSPLDCSSVTSRTIDHYCSDVLPWGDLTYLGICSNTASVPCWQYLREWPANNALACSSNIVNGIDHMRVMIGNMTCEEATILITSAKENSNSAVDIDLRNYIIGVPTTLTNLQLKNKLQSWKNNITCILNTSLCSVLTKAINNL